MGDWTDTAPFTSRLGFAATLYRALGTPAVAGSIDRLPAVMFIVAWCAKEGARPQSNNPLNTVMRAPGSKPLPGNSAGVQQYDNLATAVGLYVKNLRTNPSYARFVHELASGTPESMAAALGASGWCGGPGAPCPGYGASVLGIYLGYRGSDGRYKTSGLTPAGTRFNAGDPGSAQASDLDPATAIEDAAGAAADATGITSAADVLAKLGDVLSWLADPHNWTRAGMIAGGGVLVFVGIALIKHDTVAAAAGAIAKAAPLAAL